jgi:hypothetical protein
VDRRAVHRGLFAHEEPGAAAAVAPVPKINIRHFAEGVARLVNNYQTLLDPKTVILTRAMYYISKNYSPKLAKEKAGVNDEQMIEVYKLLVDKLHPLSIGNAYRAYRMARMITERLLWLHMDKKTQDDKIKKYVLISDNNHIKTIIMNAPVASEAEPLNGIMVSGLLSASKQRITYPETLASAMMLKVIASNSTIPVTAHRSSIPWLESALSFRLMNMILICPAPAF